MIPVLEAYKNPEKINLIFHLVELFQVVGVEEFHQKKLHTRRTSTKFSQQKFLIKNHAICFSFTLLS